MRIADIEPAPYNPRVELTPGDPDYESLRKSITEFGLVEPLVWNTRTGRLVGGHQRLQVLRDMGREDAPVVTVDLPEDKEPALNVALNKIEGRWDDEKLAEVLRQIDQADDLDVDVTGFTGDEYDDLLRRIDQQHATDFLDEFLQDDDAGVDSAVEDGQPAEDDEPAPAGGDKAWFSISYSVNADERQVVLKAIRLARDHYDVKTSPQAFVQMCADFVRQHGDDDDQRFIERMQQGHEQEPT